MNYKLEEIYFLVGKEDKVAGLTFNYDSEAFRNYGWFITVAFIYTQYEREEMDEKIKIQPFTNSGYIKARYLGLDLTKEQIVSLKTVGVNSEDIIDIFYSKTPSVNTFHSEVKRSIRKIEILIRTKPKGKDLDWIYGFKKKLVRSNIGLCPQERNFYLACKYYYEPASFTEHELAEIFIEENMLKKEVEWEFLSIKYMRKEITNDEIQKFLKTKPNKRYSRWGKQSIYFEGDYYTFHIEPNGRISTFFKNEKEHEKGKKTTASMVPNSMWGFSEF